MRAAEGRECCLGDLLIVRDFCLDEIAILRTEELCAEVAGLDEQRLNVESRYLLFQSLGDVYLS